MAIMQDQVTATFAALGVGTGVGAVLDVVSVGLAITVALVSLVALGYNIVLKRKQIKEMDRAEEEDS